MSTRREQPAVGWVECKRCLGTGEALPAEGIGYCQDCGGMGRLRSIRKHARPAAKTAFAPAHGSAALGNCNDRVQIRSGLPGGGVVMVRMQTSRSTGTTQLLGMGEAAWLAVELAKAIEQAMTPNAESSDRSRAK